MIKVYDFLSLSIVLLQLMENQYIHDQYSIHSSKIYGETQDPFLDLNVNLHTVLGYHEGSVWVLIYETATAFSIAFRASASATQTNPGVIRQF